MKAYADTGFVVSLYKAAITSAAAAATMGRLQAPVWLSQLGELEIHNAFQLAVFRGEIDTTSALRKKQLFAEDLAKGVFAILPVPAATLYSKAIELAERHSATLGTRSLDLMHVAAALILKADLFLSFDERQKKVAQKEGIKIGP
jgi:predicted nucleic acid-binding protein